MAESKLARRTNKNGGPTNATSSLPACRDSTSMRRAETELSWRLRITAVPQLRLLRDLGNSTARTTQTTLGLATRRTAQGRARRTLPDTTIARCHARKCVAVEASGLTTLLLATTHHIQAPTIPKTLVDMGTLLNTSERVIPIAVTTRSTNHESRLWAGEVQKLSAARTRPGNSCTGSPKSRAVFSAAAIWPGSPMYPPTEFHPTTKKGSPLRRRAPQWKRQSRLSDRRTEVDADVRAELGHVPQLIDSCCDVCA